MTDEARDDGVSGPSNEQDVDLAPAARRALEEAAARRAALTTRDQPKEVNGRGGLDPTRYDDWEVKGLASDFS